METLQTVAEAVLISFFVGAIMGGVVVAHLQAKTQDQEDADFHPETVRVDDRNER